MTTCARRRRLRHQHSSPCAAAAIIVLLSVALAASSLLSGVRGQVVDESGLPIPGAIVQLRAGTDVVSEAITAADGVFDFGSAPTAALLLVSCPGFVSVTVDARDPTLVVLRLSPLAERIDVAGTTDTAESPSSPLLGRALPAATMTRFTGARQRARATLPLLPSVVRGPDGLLRVGGARPHEGALLLDGFNLADPATGVSAVDLPLEIVSGVDVQHDPMAVTYGSLLGGVAAIETVSGTAALHVGVQGFMPRPRFGRSHFGRIEAIFPRVSITGRKGPFRFVGSAEYDFERVKVPKITTTSGTPTVVDTALTMFGRVDVTPREGHNVTIETLFAPRKTTRAGLSPLRTEDASVDVATNDGFAGVIDRYVLSRTSTVQFRAGVLVHGLLTLRRGTGEAVWSPDGWRGNWFSAGDRASTRITASAAWERRLDWGGQHDLTVVGSTEWRQLHGTVGDIPVVIEDEAGRRLRAIEFATPAVATVGDRGASATLRDVWRAAQRVSVDAGVRLDGTSLGWIPTPSIRAGLRYALDESELTVLKAGMGTFAGNIPLSARAFGDLPVRTEEDVDRATGASLDRSQVAPRVGPLAFPRAAAGTLQLERHFPRGLDASLGVTARDSSRLATVLRTADAVTVSSTGRSRYREFQIAARRAWSGGDQVFVSYVRSVARGDLNDFGTLFANGDAPVVEPDMRGPLAADAPHRMLAWGTLSLPRAVIFSPTMEWRSGFPYSTVDERRRLVGPANGSRFPPFFTLDLVAYKKVTVHRLPVNAGVQLFNITAHDNPRDVKPVVGASRVGTFTNSVGPTVRGYFLVRWR